MNGTTNMTMNMESVQIRIRALRTAKAASLAVLFLSSIGEILLYRTLYFSRMCSTVMLTTEGMIMTSATTAPFPKFGTLPSISV